MKMCSFFVIFLFVIVLVNVFSIEEYVKCFFCLEYRLFLLVKISLQFDDELNKVFVLFNDDFIKCLVYCELDCKKLEVLDFLMVNIYFLLFWFVFFYINIFRCNCY